MLLRSGFVNGVKRHKAGSWWMLTREHCKHCQARRLTRGHVNQKLLIRHRQSPTSSFTTINHPQVTTTRRHKKFIYLTTMLRHSILQTFKTTIVPARRTITTTVPKMAEGDAGAPRSGGTAHGLVARLLLLTRLAIVLCIQHFIQM